MEKEVRVKIRITEGVGTRKEEMQEEWEKRNASKKEEREIEKKLYTIYIYYILRHNSPWWET